MRSILIYTDRQMQLMVIKSRTIGRARHVEFVDKMVNTLFRKPEERGHGNFT